MILILFSFSMAYQHPVVLEALGWTLYSYELATAPRDQDNDMNLLDNSTKSKEFFFFKFNLFPLTFLLCIV